MVIFISLYYETILFYINIYIDKLCTNNYSYILSIIFIKNIIKILATYNSYVGASITWSNLHDNHLEPMSDHNWSFLAILFGILSCIDILIYLQR